jgi:RNA polymerase sigma-70 factor (ECF subfamily)
VATSLHTLVRYGLHARDAAIWSEIIDRLQPLFAKTVYRVAAAWGPVHADEVDDVIQETFLKLGVSAQSTILRANLSSEAAITSYLKMMVVNVARDYFRAKYAEKRGFALLSVNALHDEYIFSGSTNSDREILLSQIDSALNADNRDRTVFWLYYRQGLTAREISCIPAFGLTVKGVESLIYRLTSGVKTVIDYKFSEARGNAKAI